MKPRHRKTLFLVSVFLFTIVAPVLILSASGYRYDFQEGTLVRTGTLVLKTQPAGAKIVIDQQEQKETTPAKIGGLPPAHYRVRVEADQFRPWSKEIEVRGNKITLADQIVLIPKQIPVSSLFPEEVRTFAVSQDGRKLSYVRRDATKGDSLWLFDLDQNETHLLFPLGEKSDPTAGESADSPNRESSANSIDRLLWLMDGQGIAFSVATKETKQYFILPLEGGVREGEPYAFVPPGKGEVDQWKWTRSGLSFFFLQGGLLYRAAYDIRSTTQVVPDQIQSYAISGETIYFTTASSPALFKQDLPTGKRIEIALLPTESDDIDNKGNENLILSGRGKIALIDRHRQLWLIEDTAAGTYAPIAAHVQSAVFNEEGDRLLYQSYNADVNAGLFVYYLKEGKTHPVREAGSFEQVLQKKEPILGPVWYSDRTHILYAANDTVYMAETGGEGFPTADPILRLKGEAPKFVYHDSDDKLYFLFRNRLYQADLSFGRTSSFLGGRL
ncbi:MAG: PEGA domain-containing protein [Nitrospirae bacterium]|nr:PEGA domain-containing protein [Candidatus Manganitrophaceae bacterium]